MRPCLDLTSYLKLRNLDLLFRQIVQFKTYFLMRMQNLVSLNFMQEKREADFRYGLVRVRENAESIAFYGGEKSEIGLLVQRFRQTFENYMVRRRPNLGDHYYAERLIGSFDYSPCRVFGRVFFFLRNEEKYLALPLSLEHLAENVNLRRDPNLAAYRPGPLRLAQVLSPFCAPRYLCTRELLSAERRP
jgi:hypothetical protein